MAVLRDSAIHLPRKCAVSIPIPSSPLLRVLWRKDKDFALQTSRLTFKTIRA